jgi:hypothetical protein
MKIQKLEDKHEQEMNALRQEMEDKFWGSSIRVTFPKDMVNSESPKRHFGGYFHHPLASKNLTNLLIFKLPPPTMKFYYYLITKVF